MGYTIYWVGNLFCDLDYTVVLNWCGALEKTFDECEKYIGYTI